MTKMLSLKEVAEILNLSELTIRRFIKSKKLKAAKLGKQIRVSEKDLERFVADNSNS